MADRAGAAHGDATTGLPQRHEEPGDWGWHGSWGKWSRVGAWISAIALILVNVTWHYNRSADPWLYGSAAILILILLRDRYTRKNAWRDE